MSAYKKLIQKRAFQVLGQLGGEEGQDDSDSDEQSVQEQALKKQKVDKDVKEDQSSEDESQEDVEEESQGNSEDKEIDPEDDLRAFKDPEASSKEWKNRQRVLMVTQRSINGQFKKIIDDLCLLIPHHKQETKVERKNVKDQIDQLCFDRSCNNFIYFEQRYHKVSDLYMWLSKSPNGPAFKFLVQNIKPLDELKLTGNCLRYSRPLLSFDSAFNDPERPHLQLLKEMLSHIFNAPKNHPKSKPFIDHVISLSLLDECIYFRNYQILNQEEEQFTADDDIDKLQLIEIGPRFCLNPIKLFDGSMGGETLWQNPNFITPTKARSKKYAAFEKKRNKKEKNKEYRSKVLEEGRDPNAYLKSAFGEENDESD